MHRYLGLQLPSTISVPEEDEADQVETDQEDDEASSASDVETAAVTPSLYTGRRVQAAASQREREVIGHGDMRDDAVMAHGTQRLIRLNTKGLAFEAERAAKRMKPRHCTIPVISHTWCSLKVL